MSPSSSSWSLQAQLTLWLGGVALAVLLGVGVYAAWQLLQQTADARGTALASAARGAADLLGVGLREREAEVYLLSQAPHMVSGPLDAPAVRDSLQRRRQLRSEFAWLGVADAEGLVRAASDDMLIGVSVSERDWFRRAGDKVFVGDVHPAKLLAALLPAAPDGAPVRFIDFAAPLRDAQGRLRGVVGTHVHWRWVSDTVEAALRRQPMGSGVEVLVLDRKDRVLYPQALNGQLMARREESVWTPWSDGRRYLSREAEVRSGTMGDELGWRIVVRQPAELALAPVRDELWRLLALGLVAALLCLLVAQLLGRRLTAPIRALVGVAQRLERGDRDAQFPGVDQALELRKLSDSLRGMTDALLRKERELEHANLTLEERVQERTRALELANAELERLATRDALTGVYNRRWFDERLADCLRRAKRSGQGFALLLIDADHFKRVNDTHGHAVGDAVLRQLAGLLLRDTRATDAVARIGGEEFALLMTDTPHLEAAQRVAEKLRTAVAASDFPSVGKVTISAGLTLWAGPDDEAAAMLARADGALYAAKGAGRNRVVSA